MLYIFAYKVALVNLCAFVINTYLFANDFYLFASQLYCKPLITNAHKLTEGTLKKTITYPLKMPPFLKSIFSSIFPGKEYLFQHI